MKITVINLDGSNSGMGGSKYHKLSEVPPCHREIVMECLGSDDWCAANGRHEAFKTKEHGDTPEKFAKDWEEPEYNDLYDEKTLAAMGEIEPARVEEKTFYYPELEKDEAWWGYLRSGKVPQKYFSKSF